MKELIQKAWSWLSGPISGKANVPRGVIFLIVAAIAIYIFFAARAAWGG